MSKRLYSCEGLEYDRKLNGFHYRIKGPGTLSMICFSAGTRKYVQEKVTKLLERWNKSEWGNWLEQNDRKLEANGYRAAGEGVGV